MSILVVNAGSSGVKFGLFDDAATTDLATAQIDGHDRADAVAQALRQLTAAHPNDQVKAVGHRVVHGGATFTESVRLNDEVKQALHGLTDLAPLHNPPALEAMADMEAALPGIPQVAAFDTSFFAALPPRAFVYPLPYAWYAAWGIRRFGFHGLSHAYCAGRAAEMLGRDSRLVICHLGNGCSASAVRDGKPMATTMGFTPMEGLMMGTRCGSVDLGILLYLMRNRGLSAERLDHALNHESGLLGVSGISQDVREVGHAADGGNERAALALDIYADRVRATIGALTVTLGGIDALIFTAGVGEHSAGIRAAACAGLDCLGIRLDAAKNANCQADADVADSNSTARILVLHTREELMIARETRRVLASGVA